ncbi:MAG: glycosyltransferase family 4 protein [Candidatus Kapaibacterium sp.]
MEKFCDSLIAAGYQVTVLCRWNGESLERETVRGAHVVRVGFRRPTWQSLPTSANPLWQSTIRRITDECQPHLVIAREMLIAVACAKAARGRCAVVMDMAEHYPAAMRSWKKYRQGLIGPLLVHGLGVPDAVERRAVANCDGIITVCEENSERLRRRFSVSYEHVRVVHNTPWLRAFDDVRRGSSAPPQVFAYQGWITRERGVERLVTAFAASGIAGLGGELLIAGGGESLDDVRIEAGRSGAGDRIRILGEFPADRLSSVLSSTDIGVIPFDQDDFRSHTIPNKLFDYMASGKPVIVSDCAPLARIVNETGCGIVVDVNDPGLLVAALREMRDRDVQPMSENGRKAAETRYNWEQDAHHLLTFIAAYL